MGLHASMQRIIVPYRVAVAGIALAAFARLGVKPALLLWKLTPYRLWEGVFRLAQSAKCRAWRPFRLDYCATGPYTNPVHTGSPPKPIQIEAVLSHSRAASRFLAQICSRINRHPPAQYRPDA
jgi:hypothetical protein